MTKEQIDNLLVNGRFPEPAHHRELVETHISWVILCDQFVYKIKKPVQYSFLDFSTPEIRKHFCEREIVLNRRLTTDIYLDVKEIREHQNSIIIGGKSGSIIDYAVRMNKMDREKQMDALVLQNKVTADDTRRLAERIAYFHKHTAIIYKKNVFDVQEKFSDLRAETDFLGENTGVNSVNIISHAIVTSDAFVEKNRTLLTQRLRDGYFRDCHGDLHSRNIFLLPTVQPFDCIEFNDDFRQIDVLNEVAFLCMDLDAFGRQDLSALFMEYYNQFFSAMKTGEEYNLFTYYKSYRANVRAKVNSLRAKSAVNPSEKEKALTAAVKYLQLMDGYIQSLIQQK